MAVQTILSKRQQAAAAAAEGGSGDTDPRIFRVPVLKGIAGFLCGIGLKTKSNFASTI